jgi:cell division protein FtsZ
VNLIFGAVIDETMGDEIRITVIATGFDHSLPMMRPLGRPVTSAQSGSLRRETVSVSSQPAPVPSPAHSRYEDASSAYRVSDLDVPAFLRKKRLLVASC